jgi:hypothetical protein
VDLFFLSSYFARIFSAEFFQLDFFTFSDKHLNAKNAFFLFSEKNFEEQMKQ